MREGRREKEMVGLTWMLLRWHANNDSTEAQRKAVEAAREKKRERGGYAWFRVWIRMRGRRKLVIYTREEKFGPSAVGLRLGLRLKREIRRKIGIELGLCGLGLKQN